MVPFPRSKHVRCGSRGFYGRIFIFLPILQFPLDFEDASASSIPRLSWGKFVEENGRRRLTFDIAAHHALLDGKALCDGFAVMSAALEKGDAFFENPKGVLDEICASLGIYDKL